MSAQPRRTIRRYSVSQQLPIELYDDTVGRDACLGHMAERISEDVTAAGYAVTSEVTFNGPSWSAFYLDQDGDPQTTPLDTRDPDVRTFPCSRCHVLSFSRCITATGKTASRYHKARYPGVFAGYIASAETSREDVDA